VNSVDADRASLTGAGAHGVAAAVGALAMFAVLGGATSWIGHEVLSDITIFETLVVGLLVVFGLLFAFNRAPVLSVSLPERRSSVLGFGLFGAGYALAGASCVAPIFLAVVARAITLPIEAAMLVLGVYAGVIAVLMAAMAVTSGDGILNVYIEQYRQ